MRITGNRIVESLRKAQGFLQLMNEGEVERLRGDTQTSTAAKSFTQSEKKVAREALDRQLSINVLTVALKFIGQPEKANVYFQQHLIEDHPAEPTPPPVP